MADVLTLDGVTIAYGRSTVLERLDLRLPAARITVLVGPNGCGKSTLLRAIRRPLRPEAGTIQLDQADIQRLPHKDLPRRIPLPSQSPSPPDDPPALPPAHPG